MPRRNRTAEGATRGYPVQGRARAAIRASSPLGLGHPFCAVSYSGFFCF